MRQDFNLLAVFEAIMEEQNVTAAARRLRLSQSAVSAALARLRAQFDDELFLRARYGVVPTERARAMAPEIAAGLAQLRAVFEARPVFDPAITARGFTIVASAYFECVVVPRLMARVSQQAPLVNLAIAPLGADLDPRELATGALDLALGRFPKPDDTLVVSEAMDDGYTCLVRASDFDGQLAVSREDYEALPHVVVAPSGRLKTGVFQALEAVGLHRHIALTVSHFLAAPAAVLEIGGIATLPTRIANLYSNDPAVRLLPPPVDLGRFPMQLIWHPRHRGDPGHDWLRGLVREICADLP